MYVSSACILTDILSFYKKRQLFSSLLCLFSAKIYLRKIYLPKIYLLSSTIGLYHHSTITAPACIRTSLPFLEKLLCQKTKLPISTQGTKGSSQELHTQPPRAQPCQPIAHLPWVAEGSHWSQSCSPLSLPTTTSVLPPRCSPLYFVRALEACQTYCEPIQFTILAKESSKKQNLRKKKTKAAFCWASSEEGPEEHQSL